MRVLSRRSNLPKAVACGYSEGFVVLTEPSSSCRPLCAPRGRPVDAALARYGPGPEGVRTRLCLWVTLTRCQSGPHHWGRRPLLDGVGEVSPWRRDRALGWLCPHSSSARHVPPPHQQQQRQALRRRRAPAEDSSRRPRRALPRAGDGCWPPCGFSHRARGNGTLLWRTRDGTSTEARLRRRLLA